MLYNSTLCGTLRPLNSRGPCAPVKYEVAKLQGVTKRLLVTTPAAQKEIRGQVADYLGDHQHENRDADEATRQTQKLRAQLCKRQAVKTARARARRKRGRDTRAQMERCAHLEPEDFLDYGERSHHHRIRHVDPCLWLGQMWIRVRLLSTNASPVATGGAEGALSVNLRQSQERPVELQYRRASSTAATNSTDQLCMRRVDS